MGRDHRHPAGGPGRLDGGDQICERLAGAGGRLDHQPLAGLGERRRDQFGHLGLLRSRCSTPGHQCPALAEGVDDSADVERARGDDGIGNGNFGNDHVERNRIALLVDETGPRVPGPAKDPALQTARRAWTV